MPAKRIQEVRSSDYALKMTSILLQYAAGSSAVPFVPKLNVPCLEYNTQAADPQD
jgi:hypothetical protein